MNETKCIHWLLYPIASLPLLFRSSKFYKKNLNFVAKNFQNEKVKYFFKIILLQYFFFFEKNGQILRKKTFLGTFYSDFRLVAFFKTSF
jgi:hypothetical protein